MAGVTFTGPNGSDPVAAIRRLSVSVTPTEAEAAEALTAQRERIARRTASGEDANDARFAPYSPKYRKKQATVDLGGRGGRLLGAIEPVVSSLHGSGEIALRIPGEKDSIIARAHNEGATIRTRLGKGKGKPKKNGKATFTLPRRHFFDASPDDLRAMEQDIGSRIESRLNSLG